MKFINLLCIHYKQDLCYCLCILFNLLNSTWVSSFLFSDEESRVFQILSNLLDGGICIWKLSLNLKFILSNQSLWCYVMFHPNVNYHPLNFQLEKDETISNVKSPLSLQSETLLMIGVYNLHSFNKKKGFPGGSADKESACSAGDLGSIPGLGRFPGEGKGYPLQYSSLENSMDCIAHGVAKSQTRLSDFNFHFYFQ